MSALQSGMNAAYYNTIVSFIWAIADTCLRDVYVRGKYRDVILPMTVIRRLDAILEDTKDEVLALKKKLDAAGVVDAWPALAAAAKQAFCNASPFRLKDLTSRAKAQTLKADFEAYLDGFSPNVQEILEKFKFRNQIATMTDADILGAVISKFVSPDINLSPNPVWMDEAKTMLRHPGLDNHGMGTIFEELLRRFNEENNEEAGEHWTPRDVVELMSDLVFAPVASKIQDSTYTCYDGACGTGGMLTVAQDRLLQLAAAAGKKVSIHLFGQEINPETYAIAKADLLLKGDGEQASHIAYGSTLSLDANASRTFDFMLSNPPYGKDWKTDADKMGGKKEILDTRFNAKALDGEPMAMIPRVSDGQVLFLLNNVAKMAKGTPLGSRIAEVHNSSSIFTGSAGSGESNARRFLIENDLVEAIIAVPENMFYNTPIGTFIWVLSNKKEDRRKGKIQLIDATGMKSPLHKNMGKKNCEFTPEIRAEILRLFMEMEEGETSRVFDADEFGYWEITVERPLRLRVKEDWQLPSGLFKKGAEASAVAESIAFAIAAGAPLDDWLSFAAATGLKKTILNKIRPYITVKDANAKPIEGEGDPDLRDTEIVPFKYNGGIETFMANEVLTYAPDAWVDDESTKIGYEISFVKYFYKQAELRKTDEIIEKLEELERQAEELKKAIIHQAVIRGIDNASHAQGTKGTEQMWFGALPKGWEARRLKRLFSLRNESYSPTEKLPVLSLLKDVGVILYEDKGNVGNKSKEDVTGYNVARKGDIVMNSMNIIIGSVGITPWDGYISPAYYALTAREGVEAKYYDYLFHLPEFQLAVKGMAKGILEIRLKIAPVSLFGMYVPFPPLSVQREIVAYLDEKCAAIDGAIASKRKSIEELGALKSRIIADAVTGVLKV